MQVGLTVLERDLTLRLGGHLALRHVGLLALDAHDFGCESESVLHPAVGELTPSQGGERIMVLVAGQTRVMTQCQA